MYHKTINHILSGGEKVKFTIRNRIINGKQFYYANVINIELDVYKNLTEHEKESYYGIEITNGKQQSINYKNVDHLITDILTKYGRDWLETEK